MATVFLYMAGFQLLLLWKPLIVEGSNSSALSSNASSPTSNNGVGNQMPLTNATNTSSNPAALHSTHASTTHGLTTRTTEKIPVNTGKGPSVPITATKDKNSVTEKPKLTKPFLRVVSSTTNQSDDEGDIPFWVYILIGVGLIFIIAIIVCVVYAKLDRWKNHGSYMVWDDNELELSPAFTRESEFLLDNLATNQEPGTPELQIYEIPLDSLGHQRVYIGTKRIAPKTDGPKEVVRFTRNKKSRKRDGIQGNTLPRTGRRDHIYSSVNDEVSSTLSEGDLFEGRNVNGHAVPAVLLSSQNFGKSGSLKPMISGSPSPDEFESGMRSLTLGCRTKSVSNIFQNRPLPPAPSKRFSKSLDRLRFFEALPNSKGKGKTYPSHHKSPPIRAHPVLVKSSSFGGTFNKLISGSISQPPVPPPRKNSVDFRDKSATIDVSHFRKTNLCHRHSKSLDTLLLLRDINWTAFDVDIYHSYESVHGSQLGENNNIKEPSYASVSSDEKPPSSHESNGRVSSISGSPIDSDTPLDDGDEDHPYASVSEDERPKTGSLNGSEQRYSNRESDTRDSGVSSCLAEPDSDPASPYASVRISQIPGLVTSQYHSSLGTDSDYSGEVREKEDSASSIGTCKDLRDCEDAKRASTHTYLEVLPDNGTESIMSETNSGDKQDEKRASTHTYLENLHDNSRDNASQETSLDRKEDEKRASTHTYLELLPDNSRDSVISETSSGYARPIDVVTSKPESSDNAPLNNQEKRTSLTDLEIPNERSGTLESRDSGNGTLEQCPASNSSSIARKENTSLVSDNSQSHRDGKIDLNGDSSVGANPRQISRLSSEGFQDNDEGFNVADTKRKPRDRGTPGTGEHIYDNSPGTDERIYDNLGFTGNLRSQHDSGRSEPMNSGPDVNVNVQTYRLQEAIHTDEFFV